MRERSATAFALKAQLFFPRCNHLLWPHRISHKQPSLVSQYDTIWPIRPPRPPSSADSVALWHKFLLRSQQTRVIINEWAKPAGLRRLKIFLDHLWLLFRDGRHAGYSLSSISIYFPISMWVDSFHSFTLVQSGGPFDLSQCISCFTSLWGHSLLSDSLIQTSTAWKQARKAFIKNQPRQTYSDI